MAIAAANSAEQLTRQALEAGEGILRLAPTWVPRFYLVPGRRLKLDARDLYAFGAHRGGIDERWFASTTPAMNDNRTPDEGLSYVVSEGERFTLKEAVEAEGPRMIGETMWEKYHRWPVYSKFFDNFGPIMHHLHQSEEQAKLVGREGKPEGYYFPPQLNATLAIFLILISDWSQARRAKIFARASSAGTRATTEFWITQRRIACKPGTGWLVPPRILHAPGSLLTYEPQWGSDVLAMFQSMVEGRPVPRSLLDAGCSRRQASGSRFPRRSRRLSPQHSTPNSRSTITSSRSPRRRAASEGYVDGGWSTGPSTASRNSAHAN